MAYKVCRSDDATWGIVEDAAEIADSFSFRLCATKTLSTFHWRPAGRFLAQVEPSATSCALTKNWDYLPGSSGVPPWGCSGSGSQWLPFADRPPL